jgi:hypothetical protein
MEFLYEGHSPRLRCESSDSVHRVAVIALHSSIHAAYRYLLISNPFTPDPSSTSHQFGRE